MKAFAISFPFATSLHCLTVLATLAIATPQTHAGHCTPPPSGLVGWWPADGNANDIIGGDNGTLQGGAGFASGKVGQGFRLDGTNGYVQIPDSAALKPTNVTVEAWVWLDPSITDPRNEQIIFKRNSWNYLFEGYSLLKESVDNGNRTYTSRFSFVVTSGGNQIITRSITAVERGIWYHVAATYDGTTARLYVNGVAEVSAYAGFALDYGTLPAFIGTTGEPAPYNNKLAGIIDEASIYDRALSTNEIQAIYNAGSAGKCSPGGQTNECVTPPPGLLGWWPAEGNANDIINGDNAVVNVGTVTYVPAEVGQGFYFADGANGISVPDSTNLNFGAGQDFSIDAWIQPNPAARTFGVMDIVDKRYVPGNFNLTTSLGYSLYLIDGQLGCQLSQSLSNPFSGYGPAGPDLRDGKFHHVAMTVVRNSSTGGSLFVDGQLVLTFDPTSQPGDLSNTQPLLIGNHPDPGINGYFYGIIDEVSLYGRALSTNEVAAIYMAGSAGKCQPGTTPTCVTPPTGLVGWWKGDGSGVDAVAGNNGVLVNIGYTNGVDGLAFACDPESYPYGTYNGIQIADQPAYALTNSLTIEGWIRPRGDGYSIFWRGDNRPGLDPYALSMQGNNVLAFYVQAADGTYSDIGIPVVYGNWIHVAATLDGSSGTMSLFTNGVLAVQTVTTVRPFGDLIPGDSPGIGIGNVNDGGNNFPFIGDIDEISLYNRALSVGEIQAIYNVSSAGKCTPTEGTNGCTAVPSGLVAWWRAEDNSVDEVSGATGAVENVTYTGGEVGQGFVFNPAGGTTRISIPDQPAFILTNSLSIEGWIKATGPGWTIFWRGDNRGGLDPYFVQMNPDDGNTLQFVIEQESPNLAAVIETAPVAYNQWYHIAATLDGGTGLMSIYTNGILAAQTNTSIRPFADLIPADDASIGIGNVGEHFFDHPFIGSIDEIALYSRALSISEIQSIYHAGSAGKCLTPFAPFIVAEPTNLTVTVNGTAVLSVIAAGSSPLFYQWRFNGTNVDGATNASLTLPNVQPSQAGNYSVLVSNFVNTVVSSNAVLTVFVPAIPPGIVSQTPNRVVLLGTTATFSVTASGSEPLSYFWSRNGTLVPGATNSSYLLLNAQLSDSGSKFSCLVTNAYGWASSTNVSLKVIDTIANDLCSGAIMITGASYSNIQSTLKASSFGDPVPDCVDGFGHGVWYQFTAPVAGLLIVDTFGSDFDTGLALYTGACDALTEAACNDDFGGVTSQVVIPTTAGITYSILAGGYGSDAGNLVLHLNYLTPPAFVIQPTNTDVVVSSNASFAAALTGTLPMGLQWFFNNTPLVDSRHIGGSQSNTLVIARILTNDAGSYQLVASNIVGVVTSSVAILTPVILPPVITQQPMDQSVLAGSNVTFTAMVSGTPPYHYEWSFNGSPLADDGIHIIGSATNSLTVSNLTVADAGSYMLTVTNDSGSAVGAAVLTVLVPPSITLNPIGRSVPPGLPTIFSAAAAGIPSPTYQWQLNGTNIPGATSSSFTNPAVGTNDLAFYHVIASNSVGFAVSTDANLTFGPVAAWGRNVYNECLPPPGLANVTAVAGTFGASFAVKMDGTIAGWGSAISTNIPPNASNVVAMATSGDIGNYALRSDGTVFGWAGVNPPVLSNIVAIAAGKGSSAGFGYALRAEGTLTNWGIIPLPALPAGLNHLTAIACGYNNALALRNDGTMVVSGLGAITNIPVGLNNVVSVAAGYSYALALKANGTVIAWGSGAGTNLPAGMTNIVAISAANNFIGNNFGMAVRADGKVVTWGDNNFGQTNVPAALSNLDSVAIAAGPNQGLALVNDGSPVILHSPIGLTAYTARDVRLHGDAAGAQPLSYQWLLNGTNLPGATNTTLVISNVQFSNAGNYQLFVSNNVGTAMSLAAPLKVVSNSALTFLSGPASQTNYQGGKVTLSATVLGSGPLRYQWYFYPTNTDPRFDPRPVYIGVSGATNDTLVLDPALALNTGNYYVAVSNQFTGITSPPAFVRVLFARAWGYQAVSNPPVNVTNAIALAMSYSQNNANSYFALGSNGKLTAWAGLPTQYGETNITALSNSFVTAVAGGLQDVLALKSDGTVYAWGFGLYGQTNPPTGLNGVIGIACGAYHDLALKGDGTVVGWGANPSFNYGQNTNNAAATNVVAIAAAQYRSVALRADGTVVSWGYTGDGTAVIPSSATNVIAITGGTAFNAALRADGKVVQWGSGMASYPVPANLSNVVAISGSSQHCTALRNDGTVVAWGQELQSPASNNVPADLANVIAITSAGEQDMALFGTRAPAFTVQPWNRTVILNPFTVQNILLVGKVAGVQPITYQWRLNGTNIGGATKDSLALRFDTTQTTQIPSGTYQLVASNSYGVTVSRPAKITAVIPLAIALDTADAKGNSLYNWSTSGNAQWFGETNITHDGVDAAQSGGIGALQETILQTTVGTNWSGRYTFWWKVSSEQDFDFLEFRVNGITQASISGLVDWQPMSIPVAGGTNVLQWRYYKDLTFDFGLDAGWVDQFAFIPDPPLITLQPVSQTVNMGTNVTLLVTAIGPPNLSPKNLGYQWRRNGILIGSNAPFLILNNVGRAQNGTYAVTVTNFTIPNNSTVSSNAVLKVLVPQFLGSPVLLPDGSFQLTSTDANGGLLSPSDLANFEAQASTNLVNWVTLPNALSLTNGILLLQDGTQSNNPARFYRLLEH